MDIMNSKKLLRPILLLLVIALAGSPAVSATLTMQERVEAQRAIEEVYWRHRIWPPENPPPKPPLSVLMPDEAIRARVETTLARSVALEVLWNRPVTAAQLQAELDRMTRHSRNPAMLGEIFEALGNDPLLLRECLARPILVDRLIEGWYARDGRFHGALREEIEERLRLVRGAADMKSLGGQYAEVEVIVPAREGEGSSLDPAPEAAGVLHPEPAAWRRMVARLARAFGVPGSDSRPARRHGMEETSAGAGGLAGRLPVGRISGIVEDDDAFAVRAVLSRDETGMRIATVRWPKRSFQDWWRETRRSLDAEGLTWETTGDANGSDAVPGGGF
ncbi:MAG TPA: hypothetical protein VNI57_04325, partial [Candidatus Saccharimonadales bacterium]|nr:hypothetical protein [Candidatus Saccharimonadales bacterium]